MAILMIIAKHVVLSLEGTALPNTGPQHLYWLRPDVILFRNTGAWIVLGILTYLNSKGLTFRFLWELLYLR